MESNQKEMPVLNVDLHHLQDKMRAPWEAGDFGAIARTIGAPEAESFAARLKIDPGAKVLDVACGTGGITLPLARQGAVITGLDITPRLLDEARARASDEGLNVHFDEGFAEQLPYSDVSFDVVVSMFGVMFSPSPESVSSEMARVLKPGGRLALANWTPSGFSGKFTEVVGPYLPPSPVSMTAPFLWGEEATVRNRLEAGFAFIETDRIRTAWDLPMSAQDAAKFFMKNSGPFQLLLPSLQPSRRDALVQDFEQFWIRNNRAEESEGHTLIDNEYLQTIATRR